MPAVIQRDSASVARTLRAITMVDADEVLRDMKEVWQNDANNVPRRIFRAYSAGVSPAFVQGAGNSVGNISITTRFATCTAQGGAAPYTYNWGTSDPDFTAGSPTSATTQFTGSGVGPSIDVSATFYCTVTDAQGQVVVSGPVVASVRNTNTS